MTVADTQLAQFGPELDAWDREDASSWAVDDRLPGCAREALGLIEAVRPIIPIVLRLGAGPAPGTDATEDASWVASVALARRNVGAQLAAGIDHGVADDNLRLLDRVDAMVGQWPDDWGDVARRRVGELVAAGRRGRQRGRELRARRLDNEPHSDVNVGWLLRHPTDHYLRLATRTIADLRARALIENQIGTLAPNYQELCDLDWTRQQAAADVVCEMQVLPASPGSWTKPVSAIVTMPIKGNTSLGGQMALRVVKDPDAPFNGALVSCLAGERWLTCARELQDGTLLPLDGTRRCAPPVA